MRAITSQASPQSALGGRPAAAHSSPICAAPTLVLETWVRPLDVLLGYRPARPPTPRGQLVCAQSPAPSINRRGRAHGDRAQPALFRGEN